MKFRDPFTILKFLGGSIDIHISMAISAAIAYFKYYKQLDCSGIEPENEEFLQLSDYSDVKFMFIIHCLCILNLMLKWVIDSKKYYQ